MEAVAEEVEAERVAATGLRYGRYHLVAYRSLVTL